MRGFLLEVTAKHDRYPAPRPTPPFPLNETLRLPTNLVGGLVKGWLLGHGNVQAGAERFRGHLSVVAIENSEKTEVLIQVLPVHLVRGDEYIARENKRPFA